jgi:hypothetical protein
MLSLEAADSKVRKSLRCCSIRDSIAFPSDMKCTLGSRINSLLNMTSPNIGLSLTCDICKFHEEKRSLCTSNILGKAVTISIYAYYLDCGTGWLQTIAFCVSLRQVLKIINTI